MSKINTKEYFIPSEIAPNISPTSIPIGFSITQSYINRSEKNIIVILRNNLAVTVEGAMGGVIQSFDRNKFIIRTVYEFRSSNEINNTLAAAYAFREVYPTVQEDDLQLICRALENNRNHVDYAKVILEKHIDVNLLSKDANNYIVGTDLVLQVDKYIRNKPHSFSLQGTGLSDIEDAISNKVVSGIFLEIVDNENTINNRYFYAGKTLVSVPIIKDVGREQGIYVSVGNGSTLHNLVKDPIKYPIGAGEELGIYKTKEDALAHNDHDAINKQKLRETELEIIEAKKEVLLSKSELDKEKHRLEIEKAQIESERIKLEADKLAEKHKLDEEKNRMESEKMKRTNYYEEKSHDRKDFTETLKVAGTILAIGIGIFAAMRKNN